MRLQDQITESPLKQAHLPRDEDELQNRPSGTSEQKKILNSVSGHTKGTLQG